MFSSLQIFLLSGKILPFLLASFALRGARGDRDEGPEKIVSGEREEGWESERDEARRMKRKRYARAEELGGYECRKRV